MNSSTLLSAFIKSETLKKLWGFTTVLFTVERAGLGDALWSMKSGSFGLFSYAGHIPQRRLLQPRQEDKYPAANVLGPGLKKKARLPKIQDIPFLCFHESSPPQQRLCPS